MPVVVVEATSKALHTAHKWDRRRFSQLSICFDCQPPQQSVAAGGNLMACLVAFLNAPRTNFVVLDLSEKCSKQSQSSSVSFRCDVAANVDVHTYVQLMLRRQRSKSRLNSRRD